MAKQLFATNLFLIKGSLITNLFMAKRATGVGKRKKIRSPKTKKRLAIKEVMLDALAKKRGYKGKRKPKGQ